MMPMMLELVAVSMIETKNYTSTKHNAFLKFSLQCDSVTYTVCSAKFNAKFSIVRVAVCSALRYQYCLSLVAGEILCSQSAGSDSAID